MKHKTLPLLFLALIIAIVGCSDNATDNSSAITTLNLESEFGGYTANSESVAFDDATLMSEMTEDSDYGDPMLNSTGFDSVLLDPQAGKYHMRIVWGQLRCDSTHTDITDWTGSLQISHGSEVIRRLIHWELNQDYIIERTDRSLIEWISYTSIHKDGIVVDLLVPPVPPILDSTYVWEVDSLGDSTQTIIIDTTMPVVDPVEVTFTSGPYTRTFSLEELNSLDTIVQLDNSNAITFHALKLDHRECPAGFFNGFWGHNDTGQGVFRGMWVSKEGFITGFVKGHFGVNNEGENVLFGKYINRNGNFEGFIKGSFEDIPENMNDSINTTGNFRARIFNANRMEIGALEGRYRSAKEWQGGFLAGRWKIRCRDDIRFNDDSMSDGL